MRTRAERGTVLPPGWAELLHQGRQSLEKAVTELDEHERAFTAAEPPAADAARKTLAESLERCGQRVRRFQAGAREAEQEAAAIDARLQELEEAITTWQARAGELRRNLADLEARAV